jgi:hypothetical protein
MVILRVTFNRAGRHNVGNAAAGADQNRNEGFTRQAKAAENPVHDKGYTRHVAAGFQKSEKNKQNKHLWHETKNRTHA